MHSSSTKNGTLELSATKAGCSQRPSFVQITILYVLVAVHTHRHISNTHKSLLFSSVALSHSNANAMYALLPSLEPCYFTSEKAPEFPNMLFKGKIFTFPMQSRAAMLRKNLRRRKICFLNGTEPVIIKWRANFCKSYKSVLGMNPTGKLSFS